MRGSIIRVFLNKGYGFIRGQDGISRFFHAKDVEPSSAFDTLHEGAGVDFDPSGGGQSDRHNGQRAIKVRVIK